MSTIEALRPIEQSPVRFSHEKMAFLSGTMAQVDLEKPVAHDDESAMLTSANFQTETQSLSTREAQRKILEQLEQQRRANTQHGNYGIRGVN